MLNKDFYNFAYTLLVIHKTKYIFTFALFFVIVFFISSVSFISSSLKSQELEILKNEPQILAQSYRGGRLAFADDFYIKEALKIKGVKGVLPRIYGEYYFSQANKYFKIVGVDFLSKNFNSSFDKLTDKKMSLANENVVLLGKSVKKEFEAFHYKDKIKLYAFNGEAIEAKIEFFNDDELEFNSNGVILCNISLARDILGLERFEYSDFYIEVPNELEIPSVAESLKIKFPNLKIQTKNDRINQLHNRYYYKGGVFLSLFIFAIVSFMILLYQKTITAIATEKKEIGILRAIGWKITDIIKLKIIQNIFISFGAFFIGFIVAYIFVFVFGAPILKNIFLGSYASTFDGSFKPIVNFSEIAVLFLTTITPFMASVLFPAWKLSTLDSWESVK